MRDSKCTLSVNVNKLATLRNSRGGQVPDLVQCTKDIIRFGAEGITIHPRPDERHIRRTDVYALHRLLHKINKSRRKKIEFNIEGFPSADFVRMALRVRPDQVTLVPDPPHVLTSNAGWALANNYSLLEKVLKKFRKAQIRTSLFIDVFQWNNHQLKTLIQLRPDRVELYTEKYAQDFIKKAKRSTTTKRYIKVAREIQSAGIDINAGHDLNLDNLHFLLKSIPEIRECSIGHALISESLYWGFEKTIRSYRQIMQQARRS